MNRLHFAIRLSSAATRHGSVAVGARPYGVAVRTRMTANRPALAWRTAP